MKRIGLKMPTGILKNSSKQDEGGRKKALSELILDASLLWPENEGFDQAGIHLQSSAFLRDSGDRVWGVVISPVVYFFGS